MNFLINLFTCGKHKPKFKKDNQPYKPCGSHNLKRPRNSFRQKENDEEILLSKAGLLGGRPNSHIDTRKSRKEISTQFLKNGGYFSAEEKDVQWGFLVGIINGQPQNHKIIPSTVLKIAIGVNEEIVCLQSLRKGSLDKLLIFWREFNSQYTLRGIIGCRLPLLFVVDDWATVGQLIKFYEQELLKTLGEFCLSDSLNKICFNIIFHRDRYLVEFVEDPLWRDSLSSLIDISVGMKLGQSEICSLLDKMTLNDFIQTSKNPLSNSRKIRHYIQEIEREKNNQVTLQKQENIVSSQDCPSSFSEEDYAAIRKESKSSDLEEEIQYFSKKREEVVIKVEEPKQNQEQILLYCLNNGSDIGSKYEEETAAEPIRMPNFARKIRSKSEDATYVPDQMEALDDEFFQRYD